MRFKTIISLLTVTVIASTQKPRKGLHARPFSGKISEPLPSLVSLYLASESSSPDPL